MVVDGRKWYGSSLGAHANHSHPITTKITLKWCVKRLGSQFLAFGVVFAATVDKNKPYNNAS